MKRPALEVADVFQRYGRELLAQLGDVLSQRKRRVISAICLCRTGKLGGHIEQCDSCGHLRFFYNSCRNRHCPKCQWAARTEWLDKRRSELLQCPYFHVVFTLPSELNELALHNRGALLNALFLASAGALKQIAADPRHLGASIGFMSVLHTWGQQLQFHPHVHCIVPGGGLSADRQRWISSRKRFLLPVRVLSRRFRTLFLKALRKALESGQLRLQSEGLAALASSQGQRELLGRLQRKEWVVYSKPPFGGPGKVLEYLARYTHRVAISNHRLLAIEGGATTATAASTRPWPWTRPSSCAASCCTCCRTSSARSATTACCARHPARACSCAATCSGCLRPRLLTTAGRTGPRPTCRGTNG